MSRVSYQVHDNNSLIRHLHYETRQGFRKLYTLEIIPGLAQELEEKITNLYCGVRPLRLPLTRTLRSGSGFGPPFSAPGPGFGSFLSCVPSNSGILPTNTMSVP